MRVPKFIYILLRSQRATLNTNICKQTVKHCIKHSFGTGTENFLFCACGNEKFYIICVETLNSLKPTPDPSSWGKIPPPSLWPAKHSSSICCMGKNAEPYICARHPWGPRNAQETEVPIPPWQPGIRSEGSKDRHYQHRMQHCDLHDTRGRTPTSVAGCVLGLASASPSFWCYRPNGQLMFNLDDTRNGKVPSQCVHICGWWGDGLD